MTEKRRKGGPSALGGQGDFDLGAVVPQTGDAVSPDAGGTVVAFVRPARPNGRDASAVTVALEDRLAPFAPAVRRRQIALAAASILIHSTLFLSLWQMHPPEASVGIEVITVDVFGADTAAGVAPTRSEEAQEAIAVEEVKQEKVVEQKEIVPEQTPPDPNVVKAEPIPEEPKPPQKQEPKVASAPASGVGRGSSQAVANYRGLIAAQLARHKQYPPAARNNRIQGAGTVTFWIDSSGRVTSVNLDKSTGAPALDEELLAMVRRAAPFPPPPGGQVLSFTVPINFRLN